MGRLKGWKKLAIDAGMAILWQNIKTVGTAGNAN